MSSSNKTLSLLTATALAAGLGMTASASALSMSDLAQGYLVAGQAAKAADTKHAEGKCGADGKTAEGKCGGDKGKAAEGKCGEGKCGADKGKAAGAAAASSCRQGDGSWRYCWSAPAESAAQRRSSRP